MHLPNIEDSLAAWPPLARLVRNVSRRDFLKFTTIAGSGLTLGVVVPASRKERWTDSVRYRRHTGRLFHALRAHRS